MTAHPALLPQPSRMTVEVTTRCNMRCALCVKQAPGADIGDGDMDPAVFARLTPAFAHLDSLVLTGIGEPLLHPGLDGFARLARAAMPGAARIGIQTNGRLLTPARAAALAAAGVDRVCVSVDSSAPQTFRALRPGGELDDVERALAALAGVRRTASGARLEPGVETVLVRDTVADLPELVRWVAARGARFLLVSHLLPYAPQTAGQVAHPSSSDAALALYRRWKDRAAGEGLDLDAYLDVLWRFDKTGEQKRLVALVRAMLDEGAQDGVWMRPQRLLGHDGGGLRRLEDAFGAAAEAAAREGLDLRLPAAAPRFARRCAFVEEGRVFVDRFGALAPCYFLWHRYVCHLDGRRKPVTPARFGSVNGLGPLELWRAEPFVRFREAVLRYDYPYCLDCAMSPCDLIGAEPHDADCYGRDVPCGDCPWALGLYQCLG